MRKRFMVSNMGKKKKILIIPRCGWRLTLETKDDGVFKKLYPELSNDFELLCVSNAVNSKEKNESFTIIPWKFQYNYEGDVVDYLKGIFSLFKIVNKEKPDFIMAENPTTLGLMGVFVGLMTRTKTVVRVAGEYEGKGKNKLLLRLNSLISKKIIVVAKHLKKDFQNYVSKEK